MNKHQKIIKDYYKKNKTNTNKKTYFDNLFIRIYISSIILFFMVFAYNNLTLNIPLYLNNNFNFTKIGYNLLSSFIENKTEQTVSSIDAYDSYYYENNKNIITSSSYSGVNCIAEGTIINIKKINDKYEITIQTIDDYIWTYNGLETIDCHLYEFIKVNDQLGTSSYQNEMYTFKVSILNNNKYYSLEEV